MRFLSGPGRTTLLYGHIPKAYDSGHDDIWDRRPQLDDRVSWSYCALGTGFTEGPVADIEPALLTRIL
jgi:hypothetical protein